MSSENTGLQQRTQHFPPFSIYSNFQSTSLVKKEMMGLFVSTYNENNKRVVVEFVSIATVSSIQSAILMNKIRNIL